MQRQTLQSEILEQPYHRDRWRTVLREVLGVRGLVLHLETPFVSLKENEFAESALELGIFQTTDDRVVGIYEVTLLPGKLVRNARVGLRNLLQRVIKNDVDAALIVFVDGTQWRFTFASEVRIYNPDTEEWEAKVTESRRFTYLLGPGERCRTAATRFADLVGKPLRLSDLVEAFNVEKLNREFFDRYKEFFLRFSRHLATDETVVRAFLGNEVPSQISSDSPLAKPLRDFVKLLLGRIVFLHFLQKKGWMGVPPGTGPWSGGDPDYLLSLFTRFSEQDRFHSLALRTLFFQTLNTRRAGDLAPERLGPPHRIPYLNGGLFDKDLSWEHSFDFPPDLFRDLLDFFAQYNFTIDENDPYENEVGIDPEMLGRIFENLLEDNRDKGTFYTPREIVHYMCEESLLRYLRTHLKECAEDYSPATLQVQRLLREGFVDPRNPIAPGEPSFVARSARKIDRLLADVRICDPAIGSGAFPMGLLQVIFRARVALNLTHDFALLKRQTIEHCIHGVDIESGAVDIARLRFWLALVVDEVEPQPLPNLDYKIMQGNSLLESYHGIDLRFQVKRFKTKVVKDVDLFGRPLNAQTSITEFLQTKEDTAEFNITELEEKYFNSNDPEEKAAIRARIQQFEQEFITEQIQRRIADKKALLALREKKWCEQREANASDKEGTTKGRMAKSAAGQKRLQSLEREVRQIKEEMTHWEALLSNVPLITPTSKPYFLWHLYFLDVFQQGGFDIVIGNPPYVPLAKAKDTSLAQEGYQTYEKGSDLYVLFHERGVRLLRPGGILCFITSNSWLQTQYGQSLRRFLAKETNPLVLINFKSQQLFATAIVETNILLTQSAPWERKLLAANLTDADYKIGTPIADHLQQHGYRIAELPEQGWSVGNEQEGNLLLQMTEQGKLLKDWPIRMDYGIKTGYNPAFIISQETRDNLVKVDPQSADIIKPTLRGRDLRRYNYTFANQYIICTFPSKGIDIEAYPAIRDHFLSFGKDRLDQSGNPGSRKKTGNEWFETQDQIAYWQLFDQPKIIWGELSDEAKFTFDDGDHYVEATTFLLTGPHLKYLLGILNSRPAQWYFERISTTSGMGTNRWKKYKIEQLPVPFPTPEQEAQVQSLVDHILALKKDGKDSTPWEYKVDALVFHLYHLSEEDLSFILGQLTDLGLPARAGIQNEYRNIAANRFNPEL